MQNQTDLIAVPPSRDDTFVCLPRGLNRQYLGFILSRTLSHEVSVSHCSAVNLCAGNFGGVSNCGATVLHLSLQLSSGDTKEVVAKILSPAELNLFKVDHRFDAREAEIQWARWWGQQPVPFVPVVYDTRAERASREFWIIQEYFAQVGWRDVPGASDKAFPADTDRLAALFRHAADLHAHSARHIDELRTLFPEMGIRHGHGCSPTAIADCLDSLAEDSELAKTIGLTQVERASLKEQVEAIRQRPRWVDEWSDVCVNNDFAPDNFAFRAGGTDCVTFDWGTACLGPMERDIELLLHRIHKRAPENGDRLLRGYLDAYQDQAGQRIDRDAFIARMPWARLLHHLRMIAEHAVSLRWIPHQTRSRERIHMFVPYCGQLLNSCTRR